MVCTSGECSVSCPGTQLNCDGSCIEPESDRNYCGATAGCGLDAVGSPGIACASGEVCVGGGCTAHCPTTQVNCDGICISPESDRSYCGATAGCGLDAVGSAGVACAPGEVCVGGDCSVDCPGTQLDCDGSCISPDADRHHCGATLGCGLHGVGSAGTACDSGTVCVDGSCEPDCGAQLTKCDDSCVDTRHDPAHCGDCGTACELPHGLNVCNGGACALLGCDAGFNQCPPPYYDLPVTACADFMNDPTHCGWCDNVCAAAHATPICSAGTCDYSTCDEGYTDCNVDPSDGCEVAGTVCPPPKVVFITEATYPATLGGYTGADTKCADAATAAHLPGTFLAWISDGSVTPASRFAQSTIPYALVDGTLVANDWTGLTSGQLRHAIDLTETGGSPAAPQVGGLCNVWTGTSTAGEALNGDCSGWSSTSASGMAGNSAESGGAWSGQCSGGICGFSAALFCFEQ